LAVIAGATASPSHVVVGDGVGVGDMGIVDIVAIIGIVSCLR